MISDVLDLHLKVERTTTTINKNQEVARVLSTQQGKKYKLCRLQLQQQTISL